jgi:uncharacterized integral membrane protein (TIGR00698 family)
MSKPDLALFAGDLFGEVYQSDKALRPKKASLRGSLPGLLTCLVVSFGAMWLAEQYSFPAILLGLLIGLSISFLSEHPSVGEGLDFVSKHFLRLGIILLGLQITITQIGQIGLLPFLGLLMIMAAAFGAGLLGSRLAGQGSYAGILAGGATAICGASAALALYSIIGRNRLDQTYFTLTLVGISLASAIGLSLYPAISQIFALDAEQAGYLVGASIHDVAQAIGGGYAISDQAGSQATIIKLARVSMLAPIVALTALFLGNASHEGMKKIPLWRRIYVPWFIIGFLMLVLVNSLTSLPLEVSEAGLAISKFLLLLAVIATAMRSKLSLLVNAGWKPLLPVLTASIGSFFTALAVVISLAQ